MFEPNKGLRTPDRHHRRKASKSPINIRGKIKQLQGQQQKNNKHKQVLRLPHCPNSPTTPNLVLQPVKLKNTRQIEPPNHRLLARIEKHSSPEHRDHPNRHIQDRLHYGRGQPHNGENQFKRMNSPQQKIPRWHSQNPRNKPRKGFTEKPQQNLQRLKQENVKFREIYLKSVQKIQNLEDRLTQMRLRQQNEKNSLESTFHFLQSRIQTKKTPLAHIYTYEENNNHLMVVQEKIIAETDNENSSCHLQQQIMRKRSQSFSGLSIQSKQP